MEVVCAVGGVDPTGAAGLAADLRTLAAMGVHGAPVVSALTLQSSAGVEAVRPVDADWLERQLALAGSSRPPAAIKIGLLADAAGVEAVARALATWPGCPVVLDPVLEASSGQTLVSSDLRATLREVLLPRVTVLTPNLPEAAQLLGDVPLVTDAELEAAARSLVDLGPRAVFLKGGHRAGDADDLFLDPPDPPVMLRAERVATPHTRGTGCVLASALAALLARGRDLEEAAEQAKGFVTAAIAQGLEVGERGPVHALHEYYGREGLP